MLAIVLATPGRRRRRVLAALGAGAATGFLLLGGWWMWALWQRFGNPVYPQFAALFHGPLDPPFPVRDLRFVPDPPWRALAWPFAPAHDWRTVSEIKFRDLRVPALALGTLLLPWWRRGQHASESIRDASATRCCAALALAYAGWLTLFGYHRYLAAVEMLAPLALLLLLERAMAPIAAAARHRSRDPGGPGADDQSAQLGQRATGLGTRSNWRCRRWCRCAARLCCSPANAPSSYLAPAWPEPARFVRVQSNFHGETWPPYAFDRRLAQAIDAHAGPLVVVHARNQEALADAGLARMGVARDPSRCGIVQTPLCAARRTPAATVRGDAHRARRRRAGAVLRPLARRLRPQRRARRAVAIDLRRGRRLSPRPR